MAAQDPNPALRAELVAAQAVLTPMIRGLQDLIAMPLQSDLNGALNAQLVDCQRRSALIQTVLNDLNQVVTDLTALESDGYPALTIVSVSPATSVELLNSMADLQAAAGIFSTAVSVGLDVPHSTFTPQAAP